MQRTLAISQKTLILSQKVKIELHEMISLGETAKVRPVAPIWRKSRIRGLF